jgi:hypothetical protein
VEGIQGVGISGGAPADGQALVFNSSSGEWEPAEAGGGAALDILWEWDGTTLGQFADTSGLSVSTTTTLIPRPCINWTLSPSTRQVRLINDFVAPAKYHLHFVIEHPGGSHGLGMCFNAQATNRYHAAGVYTAGGGLTFFGDNNGVQVWPAFTPSMVVFGDYTIADFFIESRLPDGVNPMLLRNVIQIRDGATWASFDSPNFYWATYDAAWLPTQDNLIGLAYLTQGSPPASFNIFDMKIFKHPEDI